MTERDAARQRILAMCGGDEDQADLVLAALHLQLPAEDGAAQRALTDPPACRRCHETLLLDEAGFCSACGFANGLYGDAMLLALIGLT